MYAPSSQPQPSPRPVRRYRSKRRPQPGVRRNVAVQTKICELGVRLAANGLLAAIAGVSLAHLVPYLQDQSEELQFVSAEVAKAEQENAQLKTDFGRYFDPRQAQNLIQEESGYKQPTERQIVWTDPNPSPKPAE